MANRLLAPALVFAAFALTACPPTYPKCDKDDHCKEDGRSEVCVDGQCQECGQDTDCKGGFVCRANKCAPKPECSSTEPCGPGALCRNEKCVVGACDTTADCPSGQDCKAGRCAPKAECSNDADCGSGMRCDNDGRCSTAQAAGCELKTVRFGFNESSLSGEARQALESNAECLKSRSLSATIEGHADERGSEEYNLHLGEKRANAAKKYLVTQGVDGGKLKTVSYGEERPANQASTESAWSENRRVEFQSR